MNLNRDISAEEFVRRVVENTIASVKPSALFERSFRVSAGSLDAFGISTELSGHRNVECVSIGKSAESMAYEVRARLGGQVTGVIATPVAKHLDVKGFRFYETGHPLPDDESLAAAEAAQALVAEVGPNDLLLFLISGGGSASIFSPIEGVTLRDTNKLVKLLFDSGAAIDKVNLVRRHLSRLGGGKLAALAPGHEKISLVISDVVGDDLSSIASGPTVRDNTSSADALKFLEESGILDQVPASIPAALERQLGRQSQVDSGNAEVRIIACNRDAIEAAENVGIGNGFNTLILTRSWELSAGETARFLVSTARSIERDGMPIAYPALILAGGEPTVKLAGAGVGGRNQHMVLCALLELGKLNAEGTSLERTTVFSFGTDGKDGNSDAAGAFASPATIDKVRGGLREVEDYIARYDSHSFFRRYGGSITTGPTDTNVMDIFGIIVV